jgi:transposase
MIIGMHFDHLLFVEEKIAELEEKIDELLVSFKEAETLLISIPGIQKDAATVILAEIGDDMSVFPSDAHLVSWGGICRYVQVIIKVLVKKEFKNNKRK